MKFLDKLINRIIIKRLWNAYDLGRKAEKEKWNIGNTKINYKTFEFKKIG